MVSFLTLVEPPPPPPPVIPGIPPYIFLLSHRDQCSLSHFAEKPLPRVVAAPPPSFAFFFFTLHCLTMSSPTYPPPCDPWLINYFGKILSILFLLVICILYRQVSDLGPSWPSCFVFVLCRKCGEEEPKTTKLNSIMKHNFTKILRWTLMSNVVQHWDHTSDKRELLLSLFVFSNILIIMLNTKQTRVLCPQIN